MTEPKMMLRAALITALVLTAFNTFAAGPASDVERGRYIVRTSGCNDCHTAGYPERAGMVPEAEWLLGNAVGWQGPWGTTYPANLRLVVQQMSEEEWLKHVRTPMRPPMPWFSLRDMTDSDVRAIYRYVKSLGAKGSPAPSYVPPGQKVNTPYISFVPQNLPERPPAR